MKSPEQIKGAIRNIASTKKLRPQEVLQMFLFERVLVRLSMSQYSNNFILKGGLLISSMIGISERTTMDMDTTVRGIPMEEDKIINIIKDILAMDANDSIDFIFQSIEPIRESDAYNNFRIHINARYGKINAPLKLDITTGDVITPAAIRYDYPLSFENETVPIMAYSLETVLAEKYETIIRRNISTTRARDFYDLYTLYRLYRDNICMEILRDAVLNTSEKRGSLKEIKAWRDILSDIREEPALQELWKRYAADTPYATELQFSEIMDTIEQFAADLCL